LKKRKAKRPRKHWWGEPHNKYRPTFGNSNGFVVKHGFNKLPKWMRISEREAISGLFDDVEREQKWQDRKAWIKLKTKWLRPSFWRHERWKREWQNFWQYIPAESFWWRVRDQVKFPHPQILNYFKNVKRKIK
jgi:hypothetical protein